MKLFNYPIALLFSAIGTVNIFWGNDSIFGVFIFLAALIYLPPIQALLEEKVNFQIKTWMKIVLGLFIVWASLGVGELPEKIDLMMNSF